MPTTITYRHNIMNLTSLDAFLSVKGGFALGRRDVYFARVLGCMPGIEKNIVEIDRRMDIEAKSDRLAYIRVKHLPLLQSPEDVAVYSEQYDKWKNKKNLHPKNNRSVAFSEVLSAALTEVISEYRTMKPALTDSMEKNFVVKSLFWMDSILGKELKSWDERKYFKVLFENMTKEQDYLFCYLLTLVGCDVLLFQFEGDVNASDTLKAKSIAIKGGAYGSIALPEYKPYVEERRPVNIQERPTNTGASAKSAAKNASNKATGTVSLSQSASNASTSQQTAASRPVNISRPANASKSVPSSAEASATTHSRSAGSMAMVNAEKSLEELALLASSVVKILVFNNMRELVGSGSGIMIGRDGFILTNHHVVAPGKVYAVQIEEDSKLYAADYVVKTHPELDLAIIKISKKLTPIPIYRGKKKLVRGQKVVAIGSPLGLFNTVSDGIISGFRNMDGEDMIQFTAPISHGSSGGALLNMYGELIGISTAGFDDGQNLNLAVGYENILKFARGFY